LLLERALAIREQVLGPDHPDTAQSLNNLAGLLQVTGDYMGARPLLERALAIWEQTLGPDHPTTAQSLNNLGLLLQFIGEHVGARPLLERVLMITEQALGPDHPITAQSLNNLAYLLHVAGEYTRALPLYAQALSVTEQALGSDHPTTISIRKNHDVLRSEVSESLAISMLAQRAVVVLYGTPDEQAVLLTQLQRDIDHLEDPRAQFFIWTLAQALQGTPVTSLGHGLTGEYAAMWENLVGELQD
jgi:tetratricopeptide (TPR) repeat protein